MKNVNLLGKILGWLFLITSGALVACQAVSTNTNSQRFNQNTIKLGSILALEGQEEAIGNQMKVGLEAALQNEKVKGISIKLIFKNDYYEPATAIQATKEAIGEGIFLAISNVGTPTAKVTLPLLAENKIPVVGFFTGAGILRTGKGPVVNYRASYSQEIAATIDLALKAALTPEQICAYVQNDSYGMAGFSGLKEAMKRAKAPPEILATYDRILNITSERRESNNIVNKEFTLAIPLM